MPPRWSHANKDGVGTAYSQDSRVWFTLFRGTLTEVYYPLIDHPQVRDLQYLVTDGETFFAEERRNLESHVERLSDHALGYHITSRDPAGRFSIVKEVISAPHLPVVLQHTRLENHQPSGPALQLYALCAPHLNISGWGNNAHVVEHVGRTLLVAERAGTWVAMGANVPFERASVGYVGASDGWTDLNDNRRMDWDFDEAPDGNVALMGKLAPGAASGFTLALAFGRGLPHAVTALTQALGTPFEQHRTRFRTQWNRPASLLPDRGRLVADQQSLYHASHSLLLAHEDKTFPGAFIASLSIPWGNVRSGEDRGGYHLVWTRDLVNTATGLLAAGDIESPLRTLIYLAASQQEDGGFPQNFWLDGMPFWSGLQLDEVAFPILLAWKLHRADALSAFDGYPMIRAAARLLVMRGPATGQERWEEASGYSPSTLAAHIAALTCAAAVFRARGDSEGARFLDEYADFLDGHVEAWTVTQHGTLDREIPRHYVRIQPIDLADPSPAEELDTAVLNLANQAPGAPTAFPAREIVDAGFLELVRYGIRRADDPLIQDSVRLVDRVLKVDTPLGPCWRRYNHDGYGQRADGHAYLDWGVGRAWPLLTGERGHYELAAGRNSKPYLHALEKFASSTGLLAEQVWDTTDLPTEHMWLGRPTGAAMPLMWAHAEYLKLLRSVEDDRVFDLIPAVAERYAHCKVPRTLREVWKFNRQPRTVWASAELRFMVEAPFRLRYSLDDWRTAQELDSQATSMGIHFVDLPELPAAGGRVRFTFYWPAADHWEGRDFEIRVVSARGRPRGLT
ncbi:MAG: glycoside hydrolase family 15 protein [Thermoplasmata archaeon]|nr:glycoside hydrolase family 15 protein [Thermoplasmata archaeon]